MLHTPIHTGVRLSLSRKRIEGVIGLIGLARESVERRAAASGVSVCRVNGPFSLPVFRSCHLTRSIGLGVMGSVRLLVVANVVDRIETGGMKTFQFLCCCLLDGQTSWRTIPENFGLANI